MKPAATRPQSPEEHGNGHPPAVSRLSAFRLPARIAIIFVLIMGMLLIGAFALFRNTMTRHFRDRVMGQMLASRTALLALDLQKRAAGLTISSPELRELIETLAAERGVDLALFEHQRLVVSTASSPELWKPAQWKKIPCGDLACRISLEDPFPTFVPVVLGTQTATLATTHVVPYTTAQRIFISGLSLIVFLGMVGVIVFSAYITRPLRRMSRSMDRVASGDLQHRVSAKGKDDVACMGRSFNAMADRVRLMIDSRKELLAGISHELRSPLSRMKLSLEMLRDAGAQRSRVDAIDAEVDAVDKLVEELLVISRLDLAAATLTLENASVNDLIEEAWKRVDVAAEQKGTQLELDIQRDARELKIDRALAVRVLGNLVENALRYGGEQVKVSARREGDRIILAVTDNGPGVPKEALSWLFEPFFRVDTSRSRRTGGTGIGLMIVRRAIQAHGGSVHAEAAPSGGLSVIFDLPAA